MSFFSNIPFSIFHEIKLGGLPLIMYASRGGGGVNTNAYKCVQGGRGGLTMTKSTHFVRRFIANQGWALLILLPPFSYQPLSFLKQL